MDFTAVQYMLSIQVHFCRWCCVSVFIYVFIHIYIYIYRYRRETQRERERERERDRETERQTEFSVWFGGGVEFTGPHSRATPSVST